MVICLDRYREKRIGDSKKLDGSVEKVMNLDRQAGGRYELGRSGHVNSWRRRDGTK